MKKYFAFCLAFALLLTAVGCGTVPSDTIGQSGDITENGQDAVQSHQHSDHTELTADIYLCDDVYLTDKTPIHGSGTITLPTVQDSIIVEDHKLTLCGDGCDPADVVSRASQGYALAYRVVPDGELDGNFRILKFKMEILPSMADELKRQGLYDDTVERIGRNYYYLLVLDEKHYAYIHLTHNGTAENEFELADDMIKKATVQYESEPVKIELTMQKLRELADKGEELTWGDFERYNGKDVGSGLYILHFELDEVFDLFVGGVPLPNEKPMYVKLALDLDPDKYIDIRTEDIEAFITEVRNSMDKASLYFKASDFLEKEFHRVFDSHYDIKSLTISNWNEDGSQATFFYKMTHTYYNRDPDTVDYIKKAKESGSPNYEKMYEDYLAEKEMNFEFKVILNGSDLMLYSNVSPKGIEWEPVKIDDYILGVN